MTFSLDRDFTVTKLGETGWAVVRSDCVLMTPPMFRTKKDAQAWWDKEKARLEEENTK